MTIITLDPSNGDGRDLTTLDAVKRLLQTPLTQVEQDPLLADLITEASVMLPKELGRRFLPEYGTTKTFSYNGAGWVSLAPDDLRVLSSVTFDSDGSSPTVVADADCRLRAPTGDGTYLAVMLPGYARRRSCGQVVEITGDWGFEAVPADVERGVKITVKTWLREGATFTPDGDVVRFERVGRIPQDVLDGLSHYRPVLVG